MAEVIKKKKKKVKAHVTSGQVHVQSTFNNTIITVTDAAGNVLTWSSAGHLGFKGPKKATPFAASQVIKDLSERMKEIGIREVEVFVTGVGGGRESAIHALAGQGFSVTRIKDQTPIPHNGPRSKRPRRI